MGATEVRLDASWLFFLPFLSWSLATRYFPLNYPVFGPATDWALGIAGSGALLASVVLHEAAHVGAGRALGLAPSRVDILVFGATPCSRCTAPAAEALKALAGVGLSVVLGVLTFWAALNAGPLSRPLEAFLGYVALTNLLLALLHLVPGWPMDGGHLLWAVLLRAGLNAKRAARVTVALGVAAGGGLVLAGGWQLSLGSVLPGVFAGLVGALLAVAATRTPCES